MLSQMGEAVSEVARRIGKLVFGETDNTWKKHGYSKSRLYYKGRATRYSAVFKDTELIFIPSRRYQLFPHEALIETIETLNAEGLLTPFKIPSENWFIPYKDYGLFINPIAGVENWGKQFYANFKYRERQVNGEKINIGASIYNSVDGTLRLGVRSFAYFPNSGATVFFKDVPGDRVLASYGGKHLGSLEVDKDKLVELVKSVMAGADMLLPVFRQWHKERLTEAVANEVLKVLPAKYVAPFVESIEDANGEFQARLDDSSPLTIWQFYQGVSEGIWHGDRAKFQTRLLLYDHLHEALMSRQFFDQLKGV